VKRRREDGQAMFEAAVMLGIVALLFLGIFYLGKFHDVQASTIQAARYAAWERTVHSPAAMSDARIQEKVRTRLFTWNQDPFKNTDGLANGRAWTTQTAAWYDHAGRRRLIEQPDDVTVGTGNGPMPGRAGEAVTRVFGMVTGALDRLTGGEALPEGGLVSGSAAVKLANIAALPAPLNKLDLTLSETSSLAVNSWDASGPKQAALRSRTFTVAGPLTELDGLLGPLQWALSPLEPAFKDLHFGQVCPDIVPADRVQSVSVRPAYRGGGACVR